MPLQLLLLATTTLYHTVVSWLENQTPPPGQRVDVGGYHLHYWVQGEGNPTIVLDHSLGGIEGYLLIEELAKLTRVVIYDRAGYGWSDHSPHPRTSGQIIKELDALLTQAGIEPPYVLIGDSFGSYNVRLYADRFPKKVLGIVLTDGLHETGMLKLSWQLQALKLFFISGFLMSTLGSILGIIRLLKLLGFFELIKPELRKFPRSARCLVKHSFCRPKHWITMAREMINLDASARQVIAVQPLGDLPIVSIKASSFFKPSLWTLFIPLKGANQLREQIHQELCNLSSNCLQVSADKSGHFVWVDQPEIIVEAAKLILNQIRSFEMGDS